MSNKQKDSKWQKLSDEIMSHIGLVNRVYFRKTVLRTLLEAGIFVMTDKDHPKSKNQKYIVKQ